MWGSKRTAAKVQADLDQAELEALREWKRSTMVAFEKSYLQQMELAGEIMVSIRRGAQISQNGYGMMHRMQSFEADFRGAASDLAGIDGQIASLTDNIASTGSAIHQTSAAVEQISASIARIAEESTTRFHDIRNLAELSKAGQQEMVSTLAVIQHVTKGIDALQSFLEIIDDIAGKTAILSMNAAIQAAYAGEVGKGFAVVADEIRRLAESSAINAAGIAKQLKGLIEVIHQAENSSLKTSRILTESEEKVAKAAAGFQEIQQGAQELALGGKEMLQGISSLKEVAVSLTETAYVVAMNTSSISAKVGHLRDESQKIEQELQVVRVGASDLNASGMTLTQTTVKQLQVSREFMESGEKMDTAFAAILTLQHLAWVTRVRGVLDGTFQLEASAVSDHHQCDFGKWLDGPAKATFGTTAPYRKLFDDHEKMHLQAKLVVSLSHQAGQQQAAEDAFPALVSLSETVVTAIRDLAATNQTGVLIPWIKDYELGVALVDKQHRVLVDLINQLFAAMQGGKGRQTLQNVLDELVNYTTTHFADEEKLFLATDYPGKKGHLEQHKTFVDSISQFRSDFLAGKVVMGSETVAFLKDWLLKHILGTDKGYVSYVLKGSK